MTDNQFDLITGLIRMTSQPILTAARLHLVNGERQADAAREANCRTDNLARAVVQLRKIDSEIRAAYEV